MIWFYLFWYQRVYLPPLLVLLITFREATRDGVLITGCKSRFSKLIFNTRTFLLSLSIVFAALKNLRWIRGWGQCSLCPVREEPLAPLMPAAAATATLQCITDKYISGQNQLNILADRITRITFPLKCFITWNCCWLFLRMTSLTFRLSKFINSLIFVSSFQTLKFHAVNYWFPFSLTCNKR